MQWFDLPAPAGAPAGYVTPFDKMGAIGKVGFVLQSMADPTTISKYQDALSEQEERQLRLDAIRKQEQQRSALAQLSQDMVAHGSVPTMPGVMGPLQPSKGLDTASALARMGAITGDPSALIDYQIQQNDPLRKLQLASAEAALQDKRNEASRLKQIQELLSPQPGSPVPMDGSMGPVQPKPTVLGGVDLARQLAMIDPANYADNYLSMTKTGAIPETSGLPTGQMWGVDQNGNPMAVPIPGVAKPNGDFKEFQMKPAAFAARMQNSEDIISNVLTKDPEAKFAKTGVAGKTEAVLSAIPSFGLTDKIGAGIVKASSNPEEQKYLNAAQEWIRAKLRKESGAVIGPQEMIDEYATYFPVPGDSIEVIQQKEEMRKFATEAMKKESGGAYESLFNEQGGQVEDPLGIR